MEIRCAVCDIHLGEIAGRLRPGKHAAKFICAECLADLREAKEKRGDDMFNALFGGGFRR